MRAVLTDIEGTTTSLSFVKDVLFPWSRSHLRDFVRAHREEPAVRAVLDDVRAIEPAALGTDEIIAVLDRWILEDRKVTPLKALQGIMWRSGYENGELVAHVYDDAVAALRAWHARGIPLYVYSSGSVDAQKLLFGHTSYGDLTPLFSGFFDTTTGSKLDAASYRSIASKVALPPADILFLSDNGAELDAAQLAGMQTSWVDRGGAQPMPHAKNDHGCVSTFAEIR
jgi:enolase-phosphatase E1